MIFFGDEKHGATLEVEETKNVEACDCKPIFSKFHI